MRVWWFDCCTICNLLISIRIGVLGVENKSSEWAPMAKTHIMSSASAWRSSWARRATRHAPGSTDSGQHGDGETSMVSRRDFPCRSSQGWRVMRESSDGLGNDRYPCDRLVVMAVRDRFWAVSSIFDVVFACSGCLITVWYVLLILTVE